MSQQAYWPNKKGLKKTTGNKDYYLGRACDLFHGVGWHCQVFDEDYNIGYGFHKTNKFTAVKIALQNVEIQRNFNL